MHQRVLRKRSRELNRRNFPSEAWFEKLLFESGIGGYHRNPPLIQRYFGDFVWFSHRIVVEIDGKSHEGKEEYDRNRDLELNQAGFSVCRIKYRDAEKAFRVIDRLKQVLPLEIRQRTFSKNLPKTSKKSRSRKKKKFKQKHKRIGPQKALRSMGSLNKEILSDHNRRRALWVHPRHR